MSWKTLLLLYKAGAYKIYEFQSVIIESTVILSASDFVTNHCGVLAHDIRELKQQSCSLGHVRQEGCVRSVSGLRTAD